MAISIRYPGEPQGVDFGGFERGLAGFGDILEERKARKALDAYADTLYPAQGGQQEMSLASLAQREQQVARAPVDPASQRVAQAHGDMGGDVFTRFMKTVQAGGVTNPAALAAIASTGKNESGFSPKNASGTWSDPSQSGQAGTSGGILSWRGPRLAALQKFAQENGDNPNAPAPETQAKFLLAEDPKLIQQLQQARSPQEAQQMMNQAWRFAGYDQPGGEAGERVADAQALVGQFGGQGSQQAAMNGSGASPGVQMAQSAPQGTQGGSLLPPPDVMKGLLRNKETRQLGIALAQSAQGVRADQNDPMKRLAYEKALLELQQLRSSGGGEFKVVGDQLVRIGGDGTISDVTPGGTASGSNEFRFSGKSVEAQSLNGLIDSGQLTPQQAQQLGAGKTITGPNGEIIFMTPQGVFSKPAEGGQPQPMSGEPSGNIQITEPKVTIDEKKAMTFADRMTESGRIIDSMGMEGSGKIDKGLSKVWGVGEYLTSSDFKKVDQAKRDFINAQLRRESGAVISDSEFDNADKQYFPQPNDPPEVLEQKRRNRQTVIDGMARDSGPTYKGGGGVVDYSDYFKGGQ